MLWISAKALSENTMKKRGNLKIIINKQGQAATEFIIASVFLLIPLFLIVPLLGKYIDIKHAAISEARFEAWEYTVWNGPRERVMNDIKSNQSAGTAQYSDTRARGLLYFFSDPANPTYGKTSMKFRDNPVWRDHRGDSLFTEPDKIITGGTIREHKTPDGLKGILDFIFDLFNDVTTLFGDIMEFVHVDAKFDAIYTKGYLTSDVSVKVRSIDDILPRYSLADIKTETALIPLQLSAKASVLTNNWNSGSTENASAETRGLVFTAALKPVSDTVNGLISGLNSTLSHIPLLEIQLPSLPDFGYVKDDLVPYEYIEGNTKKLKDQSGLYYYE
jgi:hypothetical protein